MLRDKKSQFRLAGAFGALTLVLASLCLIALYGCGGGGGGPSPTLKVSGTVTAPQGTPAAQAPSFLQRLASLLISVAEIQALTGLSGVYAISLINFHTLCELAPLVSNACKHFNSARRKRTRPLNFAPNSRYNIGHKRQGGV